MTHDDDLERRLERWLADSARPMPTELLEEIVAEVPRTRQAGARGRFGGSWRAVLPAIGLVGVLAVVIGLAAVLRPPPGGVGASSGLGPSGTFGPSGRASPAASQDGRVWDAQVDYGRAAAHANPGPDRYGDQGVWSYRFGARGAADPAAAPLLTTFDSSKERWTEPGFENLHAYPTDLGLILHPWVVGNDARTAILTWTSPVTVSVDVRGSFGLTDRPCAAPADAVDVSIVEDGLTIWTETLADGSIPFELHRVVMTGTTLSFVVDATGNSNCDSTEVRLRIAAE